MYIGQKVRNHDNSYSIKVTNKEFIHTSDLYGNDFTVIAVNQVLPADAGDEINDTIIQSDSGQLYFTQECFLIVIEEDMITIKGKEYSESTIHEALKEYIG